MDVTGSGYKELVVSESNLWKIRDHNSPLADVVTRFEDGLGNYFEPTYEPISTSSAYSEGAASIPTDSRRYQEPFYVTTGYTANDGIGGTYTGEFDYSGAMMHRKGRGFLGFSEIQERDNRGPGYRLYVRKFSQDFPYIGLVTDDDLHIDSNNNPRTRLDFSWTSSNPHTGVYLVRPNQSSRETLEEGGTHDGQQVSNVVDTWTFDTTYGNLTQRVSTTTSAQELGNSYTTTHDFQYINYDTIWCIGLPSRIDYRRQTPGKVQKTRTVQNSFNSSNCSLTTTKDTSMASTAMQLMLTLGYDVYGNVNNVTFDSANGVAADRRREIVYDAYGQLPITVRDHISGLTNPETGRTWDYFLGLPLSYSDARGQTTSWEYDGFGRTTKGTNPDGTFTDVTYTSCSSCSTTWNNARFYVENTESTGLTVRSFHDSFGRDLGGWHHLPGGTVSNEKLVFDARGRIDKHYIPWVTGESSYYIDYTFDAVDRILEIDRPINETTTLGALTQYAYKAQQLDITNSEAQTTAHKFDAAGRLVQVIDDIAGETDYEYTVFDEIHKTWGPDNPLATNPGNPLTTITYNDRGDRTQLTETDMGTWNYDHNVFGELIWQRDAKLQETDFTYNQLGLMTTRVENEGTTTWNYFNNNDYRLWLPSSATSPGGYTEAYTYDSLSRPSSIATTIDATTYTTDLSYHTSGSGKGRLKRITYPVSTSGIRVKADYDYDAYGHLEKVKNGDNPTTVWYELQETDALGRERHATLGNGLDEVRVYDDANRSLSTVKTGPTQTATIQNLQFWWDTLGNLTKREDHRQSVYETFTYDDLNRLKTATLGTTQTLSLNYSAGGNIDYKSDVGTYSYASTLSHRVTNITGLRPSTYGYDNNGNVTSRGSDPLTWTSYNKPKRIDYGSDYAEFEYGAHRNRIRQIAKTGSATTTTYYVGNHFEKEVSGSVTNYRHNIQANGQTVAILTRPSSGSVTTQYIHRDHESNIVAITDPSKSVSQRFSFDAFGKRRYTNWTADTSDTQFSVTHITERGYTGHEHLDNTRLIHMNGRVQDPIIGRMISADPFVPNAVDGQSFNRYSYVTNNPLSMIDPSGFEHRRIIFRGGETIANPGGNNERGTGTRLENTDNFDDRIGSIEPNLSGAGLVVRRESLIVVGAPVFAAVWLAATGANQGPMTISHLRRPSYESSYTIFVPAGYESEISEQQNTSGTSGSGTPSNISSGISSNKVAGGDPNQFDPDEKDKSDSEQTLFRNLAPEDPIVYTRSFPVKQIQNVSYSGRLNYVVTENGALIVGRGPHTSLSGGSAVRAAGQARFVNGNLRSLNNASGHYKPSGIHAQRAAEDAFRRAGFDAVGKYRPGAF